eukprot:2703738-Prymnesium_polylepis.1
MEDTDGDNNPFHVANCMTTCAAGTTDVPPYLGHSNPSAKSKTDTCKITRNDNDEQRFGPPAPRPFAF